MKFGRAFTNSEEALQSFKSNRNSYYLVLSDVKMPSLSGIQFSRKFKESNGGRKKLVIQKDSMKR
jgi:CheY-like chemotaxis protein